MNLVISDAHEGIKAATWQRCRVHFQRNALAHAGKSSRRVVSAFIATAFAQPEHAAAKAQWRQVADQMSPKLPEIATLMDGAEEAVLAYNGAPPVLASNRPPGGLRLRGLPSGTGRSCTARIQSSA